MPRAAMTLVRAGLVAGWVVLAFDAGGYGDAARLVALAVAALLVAVVALAASGADASWGGGPRPATPAPDPFWPYAPMPRTRQLPRPAPPALAALGALALLTAWTALSRTWAPLKDAAGDAVERDLLYLCVLAAGALAWRTREAAAWVEPLLALGVLVVVGYGLAGRLLPDLVEQSASVSAGGRLEQPLTYWNAMGALAGIGLVLCARLTGDHARPGWLRVASSAAAPLLAVGLILSFSRGALAATIGGLLVLLVLAPTWTQLRAVAICLETGALAAFAALASPAVKSLEGDSRAGQGALVLAAVVACALLAAAATTWELRSESADNLRRGRLPLPRNAGALAAVACALALLIPILAGGRDAGRTPVQRTTSATQLASIKSNRYDYWRVGLDAFADHPLKGVGAGGFRAEWLRERPYPEGARDAHSLEIQTLCDLGLVGALLLAALLGAVAVCARRVQRADPGLACGAIAVLTVWLMHASIDWDWELPALTLAAALPAAMLLARAHDA